MAFKTIDIVILAVLAICWIIQLLYYWIYLAKPYYHQRVVNKKGITFHSNCPPVSVIIYARNNAENLEKYLPVILEQNYPQYEVIVVDDCSNDDTDLVLKQMASYPHLYYTYIPPESKYVSRKKLALTIGIKATHYDHLLFLDADSYPVNSEWLGLMAQHFIRRKSIVLGFSVLEKRPFRYAAYDYFFSNLQMMSLALANRAYMGNGKNLGYNKSTLSWQRIFSDYSFLESGEDDLLVSELAKPDNVSVELSPESVVRVDMERWWMWEELKVKRMNTWSFYRKFPIVFWLIEKISRILFYSVLVFACVWLYPNWMMMGIPLTLFLLRFLTQWIVMNRTTKTLKLPKLHFDLLIFDLIQPFVNGYFYLYSLSQAKPREYRKYGK